MEIGTIIGVIFCFITLWFYFGIVSCIAINDYKHSWKIICGGFISFIAVIIYNVLIKFNFELVYFEKEEDDFVYDDKCKEEDENE